MKLPARRGLGSGQRIGWRNMIPLDHKAGSRKRAIHVFAFAIDRRVDFVGQPVISLISLESNIVCRGDAPQRPSVDLDMAISRRADDSET